MIITGYYNEHGYQIESDKPMDEILHHAGNHAMDSTKDGTGTHHQLPLVTIKEHCKLTAKEIAREKGAEYAGIEYLEKEEI